jgi:Eukaryotic protein of unknown function (DUF866)
MTELDGHMRAACCIYACPMYAEDGWIVTTSSGKVFSDVDLSDDWVEFDDKLGESVGVYGIEACFQLHKGK